MSTLDDQTVEDLRAQASIAATAAYARYSRFRVGAALLCRDGTVVVGCNVESASYGLSMCAERNALFAAVATGQVPRRDLWAIAVAFPDAKPTAPVSDRLPCGACRQVLHELLGPDGLVVVDGAKTYRVSELIPDGFTFQPP
jgi:cytidine deaminase